MALFKKDYIIGLDIGSSSVKMAQFSEKGDGPHLIKSGLKEITPAVDEDAKEREMISAIKYLLRGIDLKRFAIAININCPECAIKRAIVPYMPKSELADGIKLEAKSHFPFTQSELLIDHEIMGDIVEKGVRKYDLIIAASPLKTIDKCLALLRKSGIKPASIITSSSSLRKAAEYLSSSGDGIRCFVDIGEAYTELIIIEGKHLAFSRKIPVAGADFTKAMTGALVSDRGRTELSSPEAERIKREVGLPPDNDTRIIDNKISTTQILAMLRTPAEHLASEIERCFDYFREEAAGGKVNSVILFGGGASLGGLTKYLADSLGVEVAIGDAFSGLKVEKGAAEERGRISHRVELAIGAGLGAAKGINLLPREIKEETTRTVKRGTIEVAAAAVILIAIFIYMGMRIEIANLAKRISVAKMELSSLQPQMKKAEAQALANKVLTDEPQWEDVFKELSNLIPEAIHIEEFRMENSVMTIKGIVSSEDGEEILADFILTLEKGVFNNVKLVSTRDLSEGIGVEFELKCWVDYEDR